MKVCSKCGNNCPDGASFCNVCGSPLGAEAAQDSTNTQDAAQNAYQAPQQAYYCALRYMMAPSSAL